MFVQGIHSGYSSWVFQASTPYQKQVPESSSTLHQFYIMLASFPSFRCSWRKKPVSRREAEGLVTELSSPRFVRYNTVIVSKIWITGYWLRSQLWHVTDANQWTVVEIEFLAKVGWKRGCQPFSCQCSQNVMHCRKEIYATCMSNESIPAIPLGYSRHPALCLHHSHPFIVAEEQNQSHAEKQKVWSRSCRLQDLLGTIQW